jgi:hypothetical protein
MRYRTVTVSARLTRLTALLGAVALLAGLGLAPSAAAQRMEVDRPSTAPEKIIGLKARVTPYEGGASTDYQIEPGVTVYLDEGERVRLRLVGTALVDGVGVEREIDARLETGAGSRWIDVAPEGGSSVVVATKPIPPGAAGGAETVTAQVAFTVTGNYDIRQNLQTGRVTFDIRPKQTATAPDLSQDERWQRSQEVADSLMSILLDDAPDEAADYQVQRIYRRGQDGARQVAIVLAQQAERRGATRGWQPTEIVGHLYRDLLGRDGSDHELAQRDPGFTDNVRLYQRNGYSVLVQTLVDSAEFARHHELERLEYLPVNPDVASPNDGPTPPPEGARRTRPRGWGG